MPVTDEALLVAAAREAGAIAMRYFKNNPDVTHKPGGAGPVTEADLAVNAMLAAELRAARPDYGWLSEESEDTDARLDTRRQLVVDPIDGTRAFIEGGKDWSHALGVVENGRVIAAAVYLPVRDLMFAASLGGGATANGVPIASTQAGMNNATVLGTKPNFLPHHWQGGAVPPIKRAFRSSLAYRLCLVGQGRFDGMMTLRPSWEWDIAAGALIATEAGATVSDQHGNALQFNNQHPQVPGVMAAGAQLHRALIQRLEPQPTTP
ncbi:inositol monophosphatase family protein [Yoonia sediminilitoris]|uniref:Myo-inositol-1(Or 4)-monophosphatase n=1 Tax=Yoonia sediminilitoris TaxID=1286148 RepID=A0A2T6K9Z4_9RHOB|nr:3'(2'),5'-bisphosphate nucleotidase CysQ [Yoonia sediminilitoris]PUB11590.1 myo-inositol-1(or 4)-monophosphatase [Yoonia sediminilitoris]RCW91790.1 myo-inositol-1(or 4)-monophosphatase [Yoonia sediminilitoris]